MSSKYNQIISERKDIFPVQTIMSLYEDYPDRKRKNSKNLSVITTVRQELRINGERVKVTETMRMFKRNMAQLFCKFCGVYAEYWALDKVKGSNNFNLFLYGRLEDGTEVQLTRDHINPRSKGGGNFYENFQILCKCCNHAKGNTDDKEFMASRTIEY